MIRAIRLGDVGVLVPLLVACGESTYDLYEPVDPGFGVGEGGSIVSTGGQQEPPSTGGAPDVGTGGSTPTVNPCQASRDSSLTLVRIQLSESDLCITRGDATTFLESPGYEVVLAPCAEDETQWWTVAGLSDGSWELRNEATDMNLDMNYAATSDGTPAVLFDAHGNHNQRFYILPGAAETIFFAPSHVRGKCLEARDNDVEMWPCDPENSAQNFKQIACVDEP